MSAQLPPDVPNLPVSPAGLGVVVVSIVFTVLSTIAVGLRVWSRKIQQVPLRFNDYASFVALLLTIGLAVALIIAVYFGGNGLHVTQLGLKELAFFGKAFLAGQILWSAANLAVKISILHLYISIFRGPKFNAWCYVFMGLSCAYMIMVVLEGFLLCTPVEKNWNLLLPGTCADNKVAYLWAAITNLLIDVGIILLPIPVLRKLQMPLSKKLAIGVMFGLGAFIVVITILRIFYISTLDVNDITFDGPSTIWSILEPTLGVVNCCLPTLRPAFKKLSNPRAFAWTHASHSKTTGHGQEGGSNPTTRKIRSSDTFRKLTNSSSAHAWQGLIVEEDQYPMVPAPKNIFDSRGGGEGQGVGEIAVTRAWNVQYEADSASMGRGPRSIGL